MTAFECNHGGANTGKSRTRLIRQPKGPEVATMLHVTIGSGRAGSMARLSHWNVNSEDPCQPTTYFTTLHSLSQE